MGRDSYALLKVQMNTRQLRRSRLAMAIAAFSAGAGMFGRQELYQMVRQAHHATELPPLDVLTF